MNHRVVKWLVDAKEGILVAGGRSPGKTFSQLSNPRGIIVDQFGSVIVADTANHRIVRWPKEETIGTILVGGKQKGSQSDQLNHPIGLSFDRDGNLYVSNHQDHRVQRFEIKNRTFS
jgi:sugar lactone lactonase YvrE